jgi:hypothetical protein
VNRADTGLGGVCWGRADARSGSAPYGQVSRGGWGRTARLELQWPGSYGQLLVADLEEGIEKLPFLGGVSAAVLDTF